MGEALAGSQTPEEEEKETWRRNLMQEDDPAEKEEKKEDPVEEYPAAGEQMKEGPANKPVEDPQVVPAALPAGVIDPTEAYKTRISKELE